MTLDKLLGRLSFQIDGNDYGTAFEDKRFLIEDIYPGVSIHNEGDVVEVVSAGVL